MKKNTKYVYSFNCWFCDAICLQMKKFTLHLEQKHIKQLDAITSLKSNECVEEEKLENEQINEVACDVTATIKIEEPANDDIKSECGEDCFKDVAKSMEKVNEFHYYHIILITFPF